MFARRRLGATLLAAAPACTLRTAAPASALVSSFSVSASPCAYASSPSLVTAQQRRFNATDASSSAEGPGTALDVAMKVNKLKRMHQTGQGQGKKEVERLAWRELNTLSEQQIATAEGKAVALLLNSWAYFARFWEKGKDGPFEDVPKN